MNSALPKSRLAELRKGLGLTQEKFAEEIGVNKNTVSSVETSSRLLNIETAIEIAKKYSVTLDWLYGLKDASKENDVLDSFSFFFGMGKRTIAVADKTTSCENTFLTIHLSSVVRDYLLKKDEIEKTNEEKDLPPDAYKAWLESVKNKYLKEIKENGAGKKVEFVLIENDENFGLDVAYARTRRQLPDLDARIALDKLNFNNA